MKKKTPNPFETIQAKKPVLVCDCLEEPSLRFAGGRIHVDQKMGISIWGPTSLDNQSRHPDKVRAGVIGSGESISSATAWIDSCSRGVSGGDDYTDFPGYARDRGFFSEIVVDQRLIETVTRNDIAYVLKPHLLKERFAASVELISDKLRLLSEQDHPPDYVVLALPKEILDSCCTVDYTDGESGKVHRDFRRVIKSKAMKYRIPTQFLLQRTTEATEDSANVEHKSVCAWNFFTGLYFKAGGVPWSPTGLAPGSCFIGISFFRPIGSPNTMRASVAQAFDEHGDGLVLRGLDFPWDEEKDGKQAHLNAEQAKVLMDMVLKRYKDEMKQMPRRVVVHKRSRFWPEERDGFQQALSEINQFDFVSIEPNTHIRILREGQYPPIRGTKFSIGDFHFLYTTGFIPVHGSYPHGHVPSPIRITDHFGDTPLEQLLQEILVLTKMNWNAATFAGVMPITLSFAKQVGDIMKEVSRDHVPLTNYKFYM